MSAKGGLWSIKTTNNFWFSVLWYPQDPQAIDDLAKQINETIKSLSNIETILEQTKDNLTNADQLKTMGKMAKERADEVYGM